jgi:hypothetical protein
MGETTPRKRTRTRKTQPQDDPAWVAKRAEEVARNAAAFEAEHGCTVDEYVAERIARTRPFRDFLLGKHTGPDPFVELGLTPGATAAEVRRAFRRLALRRHPDRGGRQEDFVRLEEAYRAALMMAELRSPQPEDQ